jgi:cytochrome c oxidase subunit III
MAVSDADVQPGEAPAPAAGHASAGLSPSLMGMVLFIASEGMFFGGRFGAYFTIRGDALEWPPAGTPGHLSAAYAGVLTAVLIASSFTMQFAVWAVRRGRMGRFRFWLALTLFLGVGFLGGQLYDYAQLGFGISDGLFGTTFYTLTGFHGAHVFGGAVGITIVLARALRRQFSPRNHVAVEAVSLYWHFVDVVWIALFTTIYILR